MKGVGKGVRSWLGRQWSSISAAGSRLTEVGHAAAHLAVVPSVSVPGKFVLEFYGGMIALKTKEGKYLSPFAGKGVLKDSRKVANRDDVWMLEDSHPQIKIKTSKGRRVSIRGGIEARRLNSA